MLTALAPLVEPIAVQDVYASGVSEAEDISDGLFRLTFYANQRSITGDRERVIVDRVVLSTVAAEELVRVLMEALGYLRLRTH